MSPVCDWAHADDAPSTMARAARRAETRNLIVEFLQRNITDS
jgi:hypothetical protein